MRLSLCVLLLSLALNSFSQAFITTWKPSGGNFTIPTIGVGYNYDVYWEEVGNASVNGQFLNQTGNVTILGLDDAKTYRVEITGGFPRIYFNGGTEKLKILTVEQWGSILWSSMAYAFYGCSNVTIPAVDAPILDYVTDMTGMFWGASSFNEPIGHWNMAFVNNTSAMFRDASSFNQPLNGWDLSSVTTMISMFFGASSFNQQIGNWNVSNVTDMGFMFFGASSFNQPIGNWDVSSVTNMIAMFFLADTFDQPIGNWDVSSVVDMISMLGSAHSFNQPIESWDVSNVTNMSGMFSDGSFNQAIGNWDVSNVTDLSGMFFNATSFNQPIGNWNVSNVTDMSWLFEGAISFNQSIGSWDVSVATDMSEMFFGASNFNQSLADWNLNSGVDMTSMLDNCGINRANYDNTLTAWSNLAVNGRTLGAVGLKYCEGEAARNALIGNGWTITGDTKDCSNTITFAALPNKSYGDADFNLAATSSSGLAVNFSSSDTGVATVSGNTVTMVGAGAVTIVASQAGNATYPAAQDVQQNFTVDPLPITVTADPKSKVYGDQDPALTYTVSPSLVAGDSFTGNLTKAAGENAGTYTINLGTISAGANYAITFVGADFVINKANQTITFGTVANKTMGDASFALGATTTATGLSIGYSASPAGRVTINNGQATITGAGRVTITASQPGNTNYNAATDVTQSFCINPAAPVVTASFANPEAPVLTSNASNGNQWFKGTDAIAGATTGTYTVSATSGAGVYKVQAKADDCVSAFSNTITIVITGDLSLNYQTEITAWPNPVTDYLTIEGVSQTAQAKMISVQGRELQAPSENNGNKIILDTRNAATGVYFVHVRDQSAVKTFRVIKK